MKARNCGGENSNQKEGKVRTDVEKKEKSNGNNTSFKIVLFSKSIVKKEMIKQKSA